MRVCLTTVRTRLQPGEVWWDSRRALHLWQHTDSTGPRISTRADARKAEPTRPKGESTIRSVVLRMRSAGLSIVRPVSLGTFGR